MWFCFFVFFSFLGGGVGGVNMLALTARQMAKCT